MPGCSCSCTSASFGLAPPGRPFDPNYSYITSPFFSTRVLGVIRLVLGIYALVTIVVDLVLSEVIDDDVEQWFSYFTHLSYLGLTVYMLASSAHTLTYASKRVYTLRRWPKFFQFCHVLLYATVITFPFLVTIVFWALLAGPAAFSTRFNAWGNISMHAMNAGYALFEILLTNGPPAPWAQLSLCVLFQAGYLGVAYVTYATQKFYPYTFLDPQKQGAFLAVYIVGIAVGECIIYVIVYGIITLRSKLTRKYSPISSREEDVEEGRMKESFSEWQQMSRPASVQ